MLAFLLKAVQVKHLVILRQAGLFTPALLEPLHETWFLALFLLFAFLKFSSVCDTVKRAVSSLALVTIYSFVAGNAFELADSAVSFRRDLGPGGVHTTSRQCIVMFRIDRSFEPPAARDRLLIVAFLGGKLCWTTAFI